MPSLEGTFAGLTHDRRNVPFEHVFCMVHEKKAPGYVHPFSSPDRGSYLFPTMSNDGAREGTNFRSPGCQHEP